METNPADAPADYDVVLLIEEALNDADAARVRSLHEGIEEPVTYHVLLPEEDAAERIEATLGGLSAGELLSTPVVTPAVLDEASIDAIRERSRREADGALAATLTALEAAGATAVGTVVADAIDALAAKIAEVDGREAIVVTRPHVVAEFFHVDWAAQARRHLDIPVLHLIEHETFDEQAGEGEGITGV